MFYSEELRILYNEFGEDFDIILESLQDGYSEDEVKYDLYDFLGSYDVFSFVMRNIFRFPSISSKFRDLWVSLLIELADDIFNYYVE